MLQFHKTQIISKLLRFQAIEYFFAISMSVLEKSQKIVKKLRNKNIVVFLYMPTSFKPKYLPLP
jgi:hypothetical protein